jgi:prolipoprotein diacylglyceryltransferase
MTFLITVWSFLFGRIGFVAFNWNLFEDTWLKIPALWVVPGFSLYAALFGAVFAMLLHTRGREYKPAIVLDSFMIAILPALTTGFLGAFLDGTYLGKETNSLFRILSAGDTVYRHPLSIYYAISYLVIFVLFILVQARGYLRKVDNGVIAATLAIAIGFIGICLELLREGHLYWWILLPSQWFFIAVFSEGIGFTMVKHKLVQKIPLFKKKERSTV